jgi:hypothetical protein
MTRIAATLLPLALAACSGGGETQNNSSAPAPEVTGDLNLAIGGDEISPIPEGEDLVGGNEAGSVGAGNLAAPPPPAAPDLANNAAAREP